MVEMITRIPLFPGDSEIDQLFRIFRLLGTPTEQEWAGVTSLPDFKSTFPHWTAKSLATIPGLENEPEACDLLAKMLIYEPAKRISAREALKHPYFRELGSKMKQVQALQQQQAAKLYAPQPVQQQNKENLSSINININNAVNINNKRPAAGQK
jgi:serine/threonine protein kinase